MKIRSICLALLLFVGLNGALYEKGGVTIREDHTVCQDEDYKGVTDFVPRHVKSAVTIEKDQQYYDARLEEGGFTGFGEIHCAFLGEQVVFIQNEGAHHMLLLSTGEMKENGFLYSFEDQKELTVLDHNDVVLLSDGSVWEFQDEIEESCLTGDSFVIKGDYVKGSPFLTSRVALWNGKELDVELVGWIDDKATVTDAYSYAVKMNSEGSEEKQAYGYLLRLSNGLAGFVFSEEPYQLGVKQEVGVGLLDDNMLCLIDLTKQTILTKGLRLAELNEVITRTVVEVTDEQYIFDDCFVLERTLRPEREEIDLGDMNISIQYDPREPMKSQFVVGMAEKGVKGLIDMREKVLCHLEINWDEEKGTIDFAGSKEMLEMFYPQNLQIGETVSGYRFVLEQFGGVELFLFIKK